MKSRVTRGLRVFAVVASVAPLALSAQTAARRTSVDGPPRSAFRILVEPNVRVSNDGEFAHGEPDVAANPLNARNLLGSSISFTSSGVGPGYETRAYTSMDGGWTWTSIRMPGQLLGAWDTQVRFGTTGTAYLLAERGVSDTQGDDALAFYRSEDGGLTWQGPIDTHHRLDRNVLVVDHSQSRYRGRVYIASNAGGMVLYHSSDDGRTFQGPKQWGCQRMIQMLVLSDGTLWLPCDRVTEDVHKAIGMNQGASVSVDGGESFSPHFAMPTCVKGCPMPARGDWHRGDITAYPYNGVVFAVDSTAHHRDRIFAVWAELIDHHQELWLRYSDDKGKSWSAPRHVAVPSAKGARQYLPMAAFSRDGVLGLFWFESLPPNNQTSHAFFTASIDGGDSFLPPQRVTSMPSRPDNSANYAYSYFGGRDSANPVAAFSHGYGRFATGGEYIGLAADADGVFHPFWPDARAGATQLFTSRVTVTSAPVPHAPAHATDSARLVDGAVALLYEPPIIPVGDEKAIAARIRNTSADTLWGPLALVVGFTDQYGATADFAYLDTASFILDPSSQHWRVKARIDYTPAMRDLPFLAPGATTEAVAWRLRGALSGQLSLLLHVYAGPRTAAQQVSDDATEKAAIEAQKAARAKGHP